MKYTYNEVAKAMAIADEKINELLKPILKQFDTETKKIVNEFDKVAYTFGNEEEKIKLIEMFENIKKKRDNSEYSEYIVMEYETDDRFFYVSCHTVSRGYFADEQRRKIMQNITIEL